MTGFRTCPSGILLVIDDLRKGLSINKENQESHKINDYGKRKEIHHL